jgi:uncharacterized membrane protein YfcA
LPSFVEIASGAIPFTVDETTLSVILRVSAAATVALVLFARVHYYWRSAEMDWPLVILVVLGGLVCTGFGWIYMNTLSQPGKHNSSRRSE